jgi:thiamine biosynthesis lipoprotein
MGTVVSFDIRPGTAPRSSVFLALAEARAVLRRADAVFSTWKPNSPMSRLRRGEIELADAPPEMAEVLHRCGIARAASGGWFDPWAMPGGVDPTGLVKGWATQKAMGVLVGAGVSAVMVSAGGDIAVSGQPEPGEPWRIGIQDPWNRLAVVAAAEVSGAIATSGTYERGDHVLDPHTGRPASPVASVTVTGPELDLTDALATALLAGGNEALSHLAVLDCYESLVVRHDRSLTWTPGFRLAK